MSHSSNEPATKELERTTLSETDRHRLLASDRCRLLLEVLENHTAPIDIEDLALAVVERESQRSDDVREVRIALHHNHLPKLADHGLVDFEPAVGRITALETSLQ